MPAPTWNEEPRRLTPSESNLINRHGFTGMNIWIGAGPLGTTNVFVKDAEGYFNIKTGAMKREIEKLLDFHWKYEE